MKINEYCKEYRIEKGVPQSELGNFKNISSFERGLSSNVEHFNQYLQLSIKLGDFHNFVNGLKGVK